MFDKFGFLPGDILIPKNRDKNWAVVACDQYTSEPEYWNRVDKFVGESPSSLRVILPEIYLEEENVSERINNVLKTAGEYLNGGIFDEYKNSLIYVERTISNGKVRKGIVGLIDLECYDFSKGSSSLVRATEGTIAERIPPRLKIREKIALELPHIMLLIDDPQKCVIEPRASQKLNKIYDFDLMENGGHIKGWQITGDDLKSVEKSLGSLFDAVEYYEKYGMTTETPLIFAVGDGNHSLASAKTHYENLKAAQPDDAQLVRYALVEMVNIYDESLEFEPIHRMLFDVDPEDVIDEFLRWCKASCLNGRTSATSQKIEFIHKENTGFITVDTENERFDFNEMESTLAVGILQNFIDGYINTHGGRVDYVHGDEVVRNLSQKEKNIGFLLPSPQKNTLFKAVITDGALPRKTFSMGNANDKRFYLEARKIKV